ncbi:SDR family oxidoreductase [Actinoallomurus sp. NPDC052274]|uniref:SDR family NAD(P)-dependent oxidoreductase n=1 Tax=Actinoallomurus sp. NPDC052274 TaxID=3155420 RepID=UPI00343EDC18
MSARSLLNDGGRIVNMGSTASRFAVTIQIGYTITKAALESMAPSLANELGRRGITVNTVAPGAVRTDMTVGYTCIPEFVAGLEAITALGRLGEPRAARPPWSATPRTARPPCRAWPRRWPARPPRASRCATTRPARDAGR